MQVSEEELQAPRSGLPLFSGLSQVRLKNDVETNVMSVQVSEEELQAVERRLRTINVGAQIRRASRATVDVSFVTGVNMENTEDVVAEVCTLSISCVSVCSLGVW